MEILFISDLHLSPERPEKLELFRHFLRGPARKAAALYILGDLMEQFWVGNDDCTPPNPEVIDELRAFTSSGARLFFIRGNRELMLDKQFATLTGCTVLPDRSVIELDGKNTLLMHGDRPGSRDKAYQAYRCFVESAPIRKLFLSFPYRLRIRIAHGLRPLLQKASNKKPQEIIDADQTTIERTMRAHGVTELIHGHTHRPGFHTFNLAGEKALRIVLGDWYSEDSVLVCKDGDKQLRRIRDYLNAGEVPVPRQARILAKPDNRLWS